ncbi:MAG TPA: transposase [Draconibacterium sp.]|nr:transposase [Draconibacterium sp.]
MRKNQKYTQQEMYVAIESCMQNKMSYTEFCRKHGISYKSFMYWVRKYKKSHKSTDDIPESFLPVKVQSSIANTGKSHETGTYITIEYPSGNKAHCPLNTSPVLLSHLVNS